MNMLMSMKSINQTGQRTCCKYDMWGNGSSKGRKFNRRKVKRSERQCWRSEVRNYSPVQGA